MDPFSGVRALEDLRREILSDGAFHLVTLALIAAGSFMLWSARRAGEDVRSPRFLTGAFALAWGLFNIAESIVHDHHLQMHHLRPGPNQRIWDLSLLAIGAAVAVLGPWLLKARAVTLLRKDAP